MVLIKGMMLIVFLFELIDAVSDFLERENFKNFIKIILYEGAIVLTNRFVK